MVKELIGAALIVGGWWALVVLGLLLPWFFLDYFPRKERTESARLEEIYGEAFNRFRDAVPALLPRLAAWRPPSEEDDAASHWSLERYSENNELGTLLGLAGLVALFVVRALWIAGSA